MLRASYTVEAVLLVPFIVLCTIIGVYFVIFVYDRALMEQDAENICCLLLLNEEVNRDLLVEHPYLAIENLSVTTQKGEKEILVTVSGEWNLPVAGRFNRKMQYTAKRRIQNPVAIMFLTEDIIYAGGSIKKWLSLEQSGN